MKNHQFIITPGEPAGVGPDIIIQLIQEKWPVKLVICADPMLIYNRAKELKLPIDIKIYKKNATNNIVKKSEMIILPIKTNKIVEIGKLCIENSYYVINSLIIACFGCLKKEFSALITGPVQKSIINQAGIEFSGHTEFLANYTGTKIVLMLFVVKSIHMAMITTHVPLKDVASFINKDILYRKITLLYTDLKNKFGFLKPRILVTGLNPHAGENGYLGKEEIDIIIPVLQKLKNEGLNVIGPFSADTIFNFPLKKYDVILTMYHDQGLPALKSHSFGKAVNVTLGLPFIRTSVDHGTALELAGTKKINLESFRLAIKLAINLVKNNENIQNKKISYIS
ncbi:4-hydroxythreonine-4-phosphate dehydrogenase PdxA [Candidatus Tachikawaea gelatinosa]|uniref:4-hydroxythreonine-4-phosphate dehydrogenase n=1 Tax=Candidatus Tachikawaea gelatinosa TaxID=1410383 RepID=A0A090BWK9_9ENTR|nr:4-hydroxythreonine-4-phosphate dehydrogenase PdxA [Candidatus Tachikawaea gelatinosa]BAP58786.1 4-hydroxythreonine-4-phosphate dehydrogenase [Candidatus Tachikawaea gelatinosa]